MNHPPGYEVRKQRWGSPGTKRGGPRLGKEFGKLVFNFDHESPAHRPRGVGKRGRSVDVAREASAHPFVGEHGGVYRNGKSGLRTIRRNNRGGLEVHGHCRRKPRTHVKRSTEKDIVVEIDKTIAKTGNAMQITLDISRVID